MPTRCHTVSGVTHALALDYDMPNATRSGIYVIENTATADFYVGSSTNLARRLGDHRSMLRRGTHDNPRMQRAFVRDGEQAFRFLVIAEVSPDTTLATEQRLLDRLHGLPCCYNIAPSVVCGTAGRKMPPAPEHVREAARQRMRERIRAIGSTVTPEGRAKISEAKRRMPTGAAVKGTPKSAAFVAKLIASRLGVPLSPEHRENVRVARLGTKASPETRAKMAESQRRAWETKRTDRVRSDETRAKISESKRRNAERRGIA